MTEGFQKYRSEKETRVIVPVTAPKDQSHNIKYLILNEEPKEYICEKGCVHKYPYSRYKDPIAETLNNSKFLFVKSFNKMKRTASPIAFRYLPPGKTVVTVQNKNILSSSESPYSICKSKNISPCVSPYTEEPLPSASPQCSNTRNLSARTSPRETLPTSPSQTSRARCLSSPTSSRSAPKVTSAKRKSLDDPLVLEKEQCSSAGHKSRIRRCYKRNPSRRFMSSLNDDESTIEIEEKEYDRNSNVFNRLYPYVQKVKKVPESLQLKMDWQNYQRLKVIYEFLDDLETMFPSLCTVGVIGKSLEGRDIKLLKISNGNANNSAVWMDAGIHAREWIGPAVNTYIANHVARNFDKLPASCTNKDWYFLPVANPDGYEYSHTTYRMWRKNRAWAGGKCVGVDLNRNFSVAWGGKGSSSDPNNCFYRGTQPFSEPESTALKGVLQDSHINFKVYITLHAFGEVIIFPLAHSDDLCPDYVRLLRGATVMSRAIYNTNGTTYRVGVSKDVMYRASGTSNDWCYSEVGIPYCYLIELRSKKYKFKVPEPQITDTGLEILNCVKALMGFVDTYPLELNSGDHKRCLKNKLYQRD